MRALTDEPVRVLATLASGHDPTELEDIPQNVQLAEYVPHGSVLKNSRLVVSHAGHGIVMKALYYGVPMVLVPWGRDQPGVAARAEAMGVAVVIGRDELDDASVERAIRRVLDDPRYRETVQAVSKRLQSEDSLAVACEHLETLLSGAS
jgi:MGT family glycosyltransferase